MRSKDTNARPTVLRELSLLRALGTSLRTPRHHPAKASRASLPLSRPPQPPDAFALVSPVITHLDQVSKLK
jgi:hypothetical protein